MSDCFKMGYTEPCQDFLLFSFPDGHYGGELVKSVLIPKENFSCIIYGPDKTGVGFFWYNGSGDKILDFFSFPKAMSFVVDLVHYINLDCITPLEFSAFYEDWESWYALDE